MPAVRQLRLSAEHATIELDAPERDAARSATGWSCIVGYSDTTVHLHEEIVGMRAGRVEAVWRVAARGRIK